MPLRILIVENDADDRQLMENAFRMEGIRASIQFIYGIDLPARLQDPGIRPQLIILAMNAQPYNGTELTRQIRSTEGYGSIPIVILSDSILPHEVEAAYSAGASSFIQKPPSYSDTLFKVRSFINYWFHTVELPSLP